MDSYLCALIGLMSPLNAEAIHLGKKVGVKLDPVFWHPKH